MRLADNNSRIAAIGCMRLSTDPERDDARARSVIHAALDAGVRLFDTADAYCWSDADIGHNERLIASALASWRGDAAEVQIATKGGLTRPQGRWQPDGRARHLRAACEASLRRLNRSRISLYQLHVVDPRVPLTTSLRALAALRQQGLVESVGLCNVTVTQIEEARRITAIASVQIELNLWHDTHLLSGVVEYCVDNRISVLAYRPLGGPNARGRIETNAALKAIAERHDITPFEVALAWLRDLSPVIVPLPGVTRVETARSAGRTSISLTDDDRSMLDAAFPAGGEFRRARHQTRPIAPLGGDGEVVLIMGMPGAGKSTLAETLVAGGYQRLNRDEAGGTLRQLAGALQESLASGASRVVLDNTYASRKSRAEVIRAAAEYDLPVRCVWLATTLEEAQTNAATRIVQRYGKLLADEELTRARKHDTAALLPGAQFRYQRELEPPSAAEGFARIDIVGFERARDPGKINRAMIVWCDGILMQSRSGARVPLTVADLLVPSGRGSVLQRFRDNGWRLLGMTWQPEIGGGTQSPAATADVLNRMTDQLGVQIEIEICPHPAGPPACWCRKPLPGLGVVFIERHALDAEACIYLGHGSQDPGFARRLGFQFVDANELFAN